MKEKYIYGILMILLAACQGTGYEKTSDGVIVTISQPDATQTRMVRLEVMDEAIIRVTATPAGHFSKEKSLMIIPEAKKRTEFSIQEQEYAITVSTQRIKATVNTVNGEVNFTDLSGKTLLQEDHGGGKTFSPITVEGTKGYQIRQIFESSEGEAFYGLGQHQADEFNYKGKNESLFQYNTKVSVPFVLSGYNYGILWDNYSLSKFGDVRDYAQLDQFRLYDKEGQEGALTATYTPAPEKGEHTLVRRESTIFYEDAKSILNLPEGFPLSGATVTYQGEIEPSESGLYRFHLYYAGYVRVWIDRKEVVEERWRTAWNPNSYKFAVSLEAGKKIPLKIEWKPDGGTSYLGLTALSPVAETEQNKLSLYSEMGNEIDYYFIYGENADEVISGYRRLTGKSQIMPKWAMGYWQSREHYRTQEELLSTLKEFREREFPIDNIVQDWNYWEDDQWGSHEFDKTRFPDPKGMIDSVHALHTRFMISVWPKFYVNTQHYKEFDQNGWMYKQAVKDSLRDWVGPGYVGSFYDAYSEGARKLFWKQLEDKLYPLGIDAWWMDASEPNIRDCTDMEYRKQLCGPTALGPSTKYFNAYALMNAQGIYEGQRGADPDKRVFLLTRSGFAGLQRYSTATWSGDIATRWEDMKAQISAGLNFSMSGIPYWTMDIGGFCTENRYVAAQREWNKSHTENADYKEWRELNTRWFQFGAFVPLFRSHGQYPYREPWNIAPEEHPTYRSMLYYTRLRYRLMPYIYSLAGMTWFNDYTLMRGLVMDFGKDTQVQDISDQYMFGPALMVCPVYTYEARNREVYFPETSGWYDYYTGHHIKGGQKLTVNAPYERMPLFVREGAIIPYGPSIQYTDEESLDEITIYVYGGQDGHFTLYEDQGTNYDYEEGAYTMIPITYDDKTQTLIIEERQGSYEGMVEERMFNVILVDKNNPATFDPDRKGHMFRYNGSPQLVRF
ncbi:MAG: DUF5110 domain-containing protein [Bacteroides sp.]|nr:DUF5110 domain-containing protein [Bacteroides sp.]